jgi:hypothetical protein
MNTEINQNDGMGNGIAFLFGAIFNLLANVNLSFFLDYALQAIVGGIICLAFKIIGDILSPLWQKHKEKVKSFSKLTKLRKFRIRKRNRNVEE